MKFLHTMVRVKDLEKSFKFYTEELGFVESRRKEFPEKKFDLVYLKLPQSPDYELELTYNYDQEEGYEIGTGYVLGCNCNENFSYRFYFIFLGKIKRIFISIW